MLKSLSIENYALIKSLSMNFESGFSAITGETGAGKSIMLGALALILGQRADTQALMNKEVKCTVEGIFDIKTLELKPFFEEQDLDYDDQLILRREIAPNGKSRAFVNDTPVNLNVLKILGERLVDIHSQHETLTLNESNFRLKLVDALIDNPIILDTYSYAYKTYRKLRKELEELKQADAKLKSDQDYFKFLYDELEELALQEGEQESMEQDLEVMNNAEEIKKTLQYVSDALIEQDMNLLSGLADIQGQIKRIANISQDLNELSNRINSAYIEMKDIASELTHWNEQFGFDPEKQLHYTERLDRIYRLESKHQVKTVEELLAIQNDLSEKLSDITVNEEKITALEKELEALQKDLMNKASLITQARKTAAKKIEAEVKNTLGQLGMKDASLNIQLSPTMDFTPDGCDAVKFLFTANLGMEPRELSKVASGGEMSRLMLAIKSVINQKQVLPTVIFDEIDTGVSGDIAGKVGTIMQKMAATMQVIAITHLPQIAAKAKVHYRVYKKTKDGQTLSEIKKLSFDEHQQAIASMISNEKVTDAAINAARELIEN